MDERSSVSVAPASRQCLGDRRVPEVKSPAADEGHDFDLIAGSKHARGMLRSRDEFEVPLDGQIPRLLVQPPKQLRHRGLGRHLVRFSVDANFHSQTSRKSSRESTDRSVEVASESVKERSVLRGPMVQRVMASL